MTGHEVGGTAFSVPMWRIDVVWCPRFNKLEDGNRTFAHAVRSRQHRRQFPRLVRAKAFPSNVYAWEGNTSTNAVASLRRANFLAVPSSRFERGGVLAAIAGCHSRQLHHRHVHRFLSLAKTRHLIAGGLGASHRMNARRPCSARSSPGEDAGRASTAIAPFNAVTLCLPPSLPIQGPRIKGGLITFVQRWNTVVAWSRRAAAGVLFTRARTSPSSQPLLQLHQRHFLVQI